MATRERVWDKPIPVPEKLAKSWALLDVDRATGRALRILIEQVDGSYPTFFLKVNKAVLILNLHKQPGEHLQRTKDTHFDLCEFVEMNEEIPEPQERGKGLAQLHKNALSPNAKYGFAVPTVQGTIPQYTE
ncbi:hypothetical protein TSTA_019810 [Talaromyces stipitatus ATCC 10500]|uniref:Uncharacterized protein n=1 Tax=Talaromyces stipitatus (strain ATCC 10500 / CBS 375.48 / QM 6759 / NRRL 1006) TaxID=441959 RepID=B8MEN7_TALSN|nr:uncharacterized protein TSTA_019810 [Talaromyces stipitatus ATCC 10500]EED16920.1 hypothetical protein TSTA_019810 [Talaromyces stipitatus ATCC 10500]